MRILQFSRIFFHIFENEPWGLQNSFKVLSKSFKIPKNRLQITQRKTLPTICTRTSSFGPIS